MGVTDDRSDPRLRNIEPSGMQEAYLVLSDEELAKGFVRPVRRSYIHSRGKSCGVVTRMGEKLCETYARQPSFYSATFCVACGDHFPVDQFDWVDGGVVGS
jgi:hypothetical protein